MYVLNVDYVLFEWKKLNSLNFKPQNKKTYIWFCFFFMSLIGNNLSLPNEEKIREIIIMMWVLYSLDVKIYI